MCLARILTYPPLSLSPENMELAFKRLQELVYILRNGLDLESKEEHNFQIGKHFVRDAFDSLFLLFYSMNRAKSFDLDCIVQDYEFLRDGDDTLIHASFMVFLRLRYVHF